MVSSFFLKLHRFATSWDTYAILFLIAWPLVYYWPVTIGQGVFTEGDILWFFLPIRSELARTLAQGRLPLWASGLQAGFPLFAEGQVAALYPLNLFLYRVLPTEFALSYSIFFNFAWSSVGMYLFLRASGFRVPGSLLGAFAFGSSGFVLAHTPHITLDAMVSWLPWLIFFQYKYWRADLARQRSIHWFLLAASAITLQLLGGYPPIVLLNLTAFVGFGILGPVFALRIGDHPPKQWIDTLLHQLPRRFITSIATIALGVCIAAIQLMPLAELIGYSIRAQTLGRAFFTSYSLEPSAISQFIFPFLYLHTPDASNMEFWAYFGVFPFLLALLAGIMRNDYQTRFYIVIGLAALLLALGGANPFYELLYYVPIFNRLRVPARFLYLFVFAASFLAATGFEELQNRLKRLGKEGLALFSLVLLSVVAIAGAVVLAHSLSLESWMAVWGILPGLLVLASICMIFVVRLGRVSRSSFTTVVLGLTIFDLAAFSAPFLSTLARTSSPAELTQVPKTVLAMDSTQPIYRVFVDKFPSVTQASIRATLWSSLPLAYGKDGINAGYNPFSLALARNELYIANMTLAMRDLINIRYYLLPLQTAPPGNPSPFDLSEPDGGLSLNILSQQPKIPPTRVARIRLVSYTDQTVDLPDGFLAGELVLTLDGGKKLTIPIRLGKETAEWDYDGLVDLGKINHPKPSTGVDFPAYLSSVGHDFQGKKYVTLYDMDAGAVPVTVTAVGLDSFLPKAELTIDEVSLINEQGQVISLAELLHRNDLTLVFRSHTAAMWENRSVLPRAFMVHSAEIVDDEQALAKLEQPDFRPDQVVLLSDGQAMVEQNGIKKASIKDQITIVSYNSEHIEVNVNTPSAGYLVLTDSWYPGWEAIVDGQDVPIHRADYIFRAVKLEPGEHMIVFEYQPRSFAIGAIISGLSLILCVLLVIFSYLRSSRHSVKVSSDVA